MHRKCTARSLLLTGLLASGLLMTGFTTAGPGVGRGPAPYPPAVGEPHPDFSAFDQDGQGFNLAAQQGKAVILHWCTIWCQPCRNSAEAEAAFIADVNALIGVDSWMLIDALLENNFGEPSEQTDAQLWRSELGTPARTLHAEGSASSEMFQTGGQVAALPTYVVIDIFGTVTGTVEGFDGALTLGALADLVRDAAGPPVFIDGFEP